MRDYNFFESYQKKRSVNINVKSPVFFGMIVIMLILAASVYSFVQNVILGARLAMAASEFAEIQSTQEYQEAVKLQDSINSMIQYDQNAGIALDRINQGKNLNTELLKKISASIPSTAIMQNATITRTTADFSFDVPNEHTAAELTRNMDESGLFLHTQLISVTRNQEKANYSATVSCILKAGESK